MFVKHFFCFVTALFLSLNSMVSSEKFCDAFRRNGNKIGYVLRDDKSVDGFNRYFFIISDQYWTAKLSDSEEGSQEKETFDLDVMDSKSCFPFYSGDYYMAFGLRFENTDCGANCLILFQRTNWTQLKVGTGEEIIKQLTDKTQRPDITLNGVKTRPKVAFSEFKDVKGSEGDSRLVTIVQSLPNNVVTRYDLTYKGTTLLATITTEGESLKAIEELKSSYDLIGVVPRWSTRLNAYSHTYLFQDNMTIKWCFNKASEAPGGSCKEPLVLVNCTLPPIGSPDDSPDIPTEVPEKINSWLLIVIVVTTVLIIIILIGIIVFLCRQKKTESQSKSTSVSSHPSAKNGGGGGTTSTVQSTTFSTAFKLPKPKV